MPESFHVERLKYWGAGGGGALFLAALLSALVWILSSGLYSSW
jgi:hypothetical protein